MTTPTRAEAWQLLTEWTPGEALRKHGLAVEATVRWYAENRFGIVEPELVSRFANG
jgi:predicted hydrolase (HD superfamily)